MAFSPDTVQTLLVTHWTCSTPTDPPCPVSFEKSSAIRSALHWVYQGVICYQCTFHPIVNFQWCIKLLESGQPLKARPCGPLPPTYSCRHTSPAHFFLFWPETQSGAWGKTWILEGGEVSLTCPQDTRIAVVLRLKKNIHQCSVTTGHFTFCNLTVDTEKTWMLNWCSILWCITQYMNFNWSLLSAQSKFSAGSLSVNCIYPH